MSTWLRLIFYCLKGQGNIILYLSWPFQVIIDGKQTRVKQNGKQTVHSVSTVPLPQQMNIRKKGPQYVYTLGNKDSSSFCFFVFFFAR